MWKIFKTQTNLEVKNIVSENTVNRINRLNTPKASISKFEDIAIKTIEWEESCRTTSSSLMMCSRDPWKTGRRMGRGQKNNWRNNCWKLSKFEENCKPTDLSSTHSKHKKQGRGGWGWGRGHNYSQGLITTLIKIHDKERILEAGKKKKNLICAKIRKKLQVGKMKVNWIDLRIWGKTQPSGEFPGGELGVLLFCLPIYSNLSTWEAWN